MESRRERRQRSADMELGRRYPWWYGATRAQLAAMLAALSLVGFAVGWAAAPEAMALGLRWALIAFGGLAVSWAFWYVGIRRR